MKKALSVIIFFALSFCYSVDLSAGLRSRISSPRDLVVKHIVNEQSPITVFAHGLGADYRHAVSYIDYLCSGNCVSFNFPDAPEKTYWRNVHTGIAQDSEIRRLQLVINQTVLEHKKPLILYGVSRGASTIINAVGKLAQEGMLDWSVKALVLESPFAHCRDAVEGIARQLKMRPSMISSMAKIFFKEYDEKKNIPIDLVQYIPHDIPILLICSAEDNIVPASSTRKLYEKLRANGHENVYLLDLPYGIHANIMWGACGKEYRAVLHAFYRSAGLSCDEALANLGQERFERCQPKPLNV